MKLHFSNRNNTFERLRALGLRLAVLALAVCAISFLSLLAPSASAQKTTGLITGTLSDPSGAVVPGATVTIVNERTSATRSTTTNEQGSFSFPELDAGTYTLTATKTGFKKLTQKNVELHVADVTNLAVKMEMGEAAETVVVEAAAVVVNTQTGDVGNIMVGEQVRELPMNGRNFVQLTTLVPGAAVGESFDNKNKGLFSGVDISFSGSPSVDNQWTVDGAANNDIGSQRTILTYPSIDGIEEFKIQRNSYGPEYGGASGAQINIVTKGGANQFHGDVYYFGRNDLLNSKTFFLGECAGSPGCDKQMLRRNDFGYTIGGPVKKEKVFFFWSEEWNRERRGRVQHHCVPTTAERNGDFSSPSCGPIPVDPANGQPFANNAIPASRLSPAGQAYLAPLPLPNLSTPFNGDNWVSQVEIPVNWREESIRGDWNVTKKNTLMIKYTQDSWLNFKHADEAAGLWGDSDFPALSDTWNQPGKMSVAKLTTTISNTAVNDFQFSWSGNRIYISQAGDNPSLNGAINTAMPRLFPFSDKSHTNNVPEPTCWCGSPSGLLGIQGPWVNRQDLFQWKDDFSKVSGKHTFKAGFLYTRNAKDETVGDEGGEYWGGGDANSPAVDYQGPGWTSPNPANCPASGGTGWGPCTIGTGNYYADYLLKGETFGYDETQREHFALVRWRDYEFYGGDAFKVSRRVTLNYGARWSLIRAPYLDDNKLAGFSPAVYFAESSAPAADPCRGMVLAKGAINTCPAIGSVVTPPYFENRSLVHDNNHMVMPRLGIAWDVFGTGRFAIRTGVGQFESRDRLLAISMRSNNPPFGVGTGAVRTLDGPLNIIPGSNGNNSTCSTQGCAYNVSLGGSPHQGLDPSNKQSNSWQWNLTTETALWRNSKLEVGWVANRGIHLQNVYDANQIPLANRLQAAQIAVTGGKTDFLKPFPYNQSAQMPIWSHTGDSIYHSLQAMFTNRFQNNSILQVAYTFSKNLGDTTFGYVGTSTVFADNTNHRANRGPVDFDRRHVLSATLIYNLPNLTKSNSILRQVAGGWETNSIVNYASGNALTIQGSNGVGDATGTGTTSGLFVNRPLRVLNQPCHLSNSPRNQWLNPLAFTWNGYQLGTFGNTGPGQCAGPPVDNVDFALMKNWRLTERVKMQFRVEMFNVFNHPQFRFAGNNLSFNVPGCNLFLMDASGNPTVCAPGGIVINKVISNGGAFAVNASGTSCNAAPTTCVGIAVASPGYQVNNSLAPIKFGQPQDPSQSGNREIQYALKFIF